MKSNFVNRPTAPAPAVACPALVLVLVLVPALAAAPRATGTAEPGPVLEPGPRTGAATAGSATADLGPGAAAPALRGELNARLAEVFAAERELVAVLQERLARAGDHAEALALQAAIAGAKEQAERDCLEIQLDIARRAGWSGAVAALEADLAALAAVVGEAANAAPANAERP